MADTTGPGARYRMLETIRAYGLSRLAEAGETEAARDAHLDLQLATLSELARCWKATGSPGGYG